MRNRRNKLLICLITSLMTLLCFCFSSAVEEPQKEDTRQNKVIKVGFPIQYGFTEKDADGNYGGYVYEYLMKMAQRTGWKYEFVEADNTDEELLKLFEKLEAGEIDLIGSVNKVPQTEEQYELSSFAAGQVNYVVLADAKNDNLNERTLYKKENLTVAVNRAAAKRDQLFFDYCDSKKIPLRIVYMDKHQQCVKAVKNGEADIVLGKDIGENQGLKVVTSFGTQPFYFASTKGNTELIGQLDEIMMEINTLDPYFTMKLHNKYFMNVDNQYLALTEDERELIKVLKPLKVGVLADSAPIQYVDNKTGDYRGFVIDALKKISKNTGLQFEFVSLKNLDQAKEWQKAGKLDLIAGVPYEYNMAERYELLLTSPLMSLPVVLVSNKQGESHNSKTLVGGFVDLGEMNIDDTRYISSASEALELVNQGEFEKAYLDGYMTQYYSARKQYSNINITQTPYGNYPICIGVCRSTDIRVVNILEQGIGSLNSQIMEDIIYQNMLYTTDITFMDYIRRQPMVGVVLTISVASLIILLLFLLLMRAMKLKKIISAEKDHFEDIAQYDQLTATYNNQTFKRFASEYLENKKAAGTLLICDVDRFKNINDTMGHMAGDQVLADIGALFRKTFPEKSIAGRIGGDEFMILVRDCTDVNQMEEYCRKLMLDCKGVTDQMEITLSIGAVIFQGETDFNSLYKRADEMLYFVKNNNRNGFKIMDMRG